MQTPDFTLLGPDETAQQVLQLTPKQLENFAATFSNDQLQATIIRLTPDNDPHWQGKMRAMVQGVAQRSQLESIGRVLNVKQLLELLDAAADSDVAWQDKLQFILVGLPQNVFEASLDGITDRQLRALKAVGSTESLQHHLTLLVHELARKAEQTAVGLEGLERQIEVYNVHTVHQKDIDTFLQRIEEALDFFLHGLSLLDTSLGLAWNTNREDLIDRFTQLKENWLRYLQFVIGRPGTSETPSSALYAKLDRHLNAIYGDPSNPVEHDVLEDSDPALEALTALSLWVLQDYWGVGLLPGITHVEDLDLDSTHTDAERILYREKLMLVAQENLNILGLATVGDLKKARIYSRNMLSRYIERHRERLNSYEPRE